MPITGKPVPLGSVHGLQFVGRIKRGAPIGQDFAWFEWPDCRDPAKDPDMYFDCELQGENVDCKAPGYGKKPYGCGSIYVYGIQWIEMDDADRKRVIAQLKAEKEKLIAGKVAELTKLQNELEKIA
jgi:hypothetical protein